MRLDQSPALGRVRNPTVRTWLEGLRPLLLIGNEWVPAKSGETFESIDPVSEGVLAHVASAQADDVDVAVRSARAAFEEGPWSRMGPAQRGDLLRAFADLIERNADELAELESLDNGMVLSFAKALITATLGELEFYAGAARLVCGETVASDPAYFTYTLREPVGVCAGIIPWNAPIICAIQKIAPALAAGNTLVLKPAEQTPLAAMRLGELAIEAGFPPGVLNILTGFGETAGAALVNHPDVDKVGFTGSTEVGKSILAASAGNLKRVTLELGGKSPNIVFPDANMDAVLPATMFGYAANAGQVCCLGSRVFVQREFKDEFVEQLAKYSESIRLGDPLDADTTMGPLVSKDQYDRVRGYLEIGASEGASARIGGAVRQGPGYFVEPTIFDGVDNTMRIAREEIFGPVVSVIPFSDEYDAILQGNDTTYGLAAAIWTSDLSRAHVVARKIKAGTVWINTILYADPSMPLGGYKQSGIGRQGGPRWFERYTEEKAVYLKV